jgi:signal transduction histidine kinase
MPEETRVGKTPGARSPVLPFQKRRQLERDLEHVTEEMYRRNKELSDTNKTLSLLQTIDALVLEPHASLKVVCAHITQAITQATSYPLVVLFTRTSATKEELRLHGYSGKDYLGVNLEPLPNRPIYLKLEEEWAASLQSSRVRDIESMTHEELATFVDRPVSDVQQFLKTVPIKSVYEVKLAVRHHLVGVLAVGFYQPASHINLEGSDILLIKRLSESIGLALDNKLLFEENRHVMRQLRDSNAKLRALDEAKDDFVSMASHQLRTPLTSVKGYVSMVLEGDAGDINDAQRKLLSQAMYSSQRMVYLIADLLNVSRLRTGKFVIDDSPVNLAELIQEEIDQLKEAVTLHSLKMNYKQPKEFPSLMLDETKIRQLIMNFLDNAIYYTPSGGEITVSLVETEKSVEFRVKDSGIGVPKKEQPHLFTKFYRAGNARKARPDGTGLGLYMAKKVIIAQGGAIIFDSKEGKGSTFGFTFSKSKLAVPEQALPPTQPEPKAAKNDK